MLANSSSVKPAISASFLRADSLASCLANCTPFQVVLLHSAVASLSAIKASLSAPVKFNNLVIYTDIIIVSSLDFAIVISFIY
jgi:hypothetical protein